MAPRSPHVSLDQFQGSVPRAKPNKFSPGGNKPLQNSVAGGFDWRQTGLLNTTLELISQMRQGNSSFWPLLSWPQGPCSKVTHRKAPRHTWE